MAFYCENYVVLLQPCVDCGSVRIEVSFVRVHADCSLEVYESLVDLVELQETHAFAFYDRLATNISCILVVNFDRVGEVIVGSLILSSLCVGVTSRRVILRIDFLVLVGLILSKNLEYKQ